MLCRRSMIPLAKFLAKHEEDIAGGKPEFGELRLTFFDLIGRWPNGKSTKGDAESSSGTKTEG